MEFKIISSNIRFDNPGDKEHAWPFRKPILCKIINDFAPDLLGTQEGRKPQILDLEQGLKSLQLVHSHRDWIIDRMYPSIFVNPKSIEVLDSGDFWLSKTPDVPGSSSFDSSFPRLCTWIKGKFREIDKAFIYANCHLDHVKSETRLGQIGVLTEEIKKISEDLPIIISGDFNESPKEGVRDHLNNNFKELVDPWDKAEEGSHHKFNGDTTKTQRIDWIMLSNPFECQQIELDKSLESGIYPSDHFPLKMVSKIIL